MSAVSLAFDPFDESVLADPYAHHAHVREAAPLVWLEPLGCYAMARYAEVQSALRDHATYCSGRGVGLTDFARETPWRPPSLLLEADPPLHTRTRAVVNRIVSLSTLRALRPTWSERAEELADRLVAKRIFDAVTELREVYPMLVFPDTIGVPKEGREQLLLYAAATFNAFGPRNAIFDRSEAAAREAMQWVNDACKRASLSPGGWGAAVYAAADRGECTESEAERLVRSFLSAGMDTTVNGISHMIYGFARFPQEWAKLRTKPKLAQKSFDESLRWDSTVQFFFRTTTRDIDVAGETIHEGAKVMLFLGAANRDPRRWDNPDQFEIDRIAGGHVAFGSGIHQCLGQMVARLEAELVLDALLKRVKAIRLAGNPVRRLNNTLHAISHLPVEVVPA